MQKSGITMDLCHSENRILGNSLIDFSVHPVLTPKKFN